MYISLKQKLDFSSERGGIFSLNFIFSRRRRLRFQLLFMLKMNMNLKTSFISEAALWILDYEVNTFYCLFSITKNFKIFIYWGCTPPPPLSRPLRNLYSLTLWGPTFFYKRNKAVASESVTTWKVLTIIIIILVLTATTQIENFEIEKEKNTQKVYSSRSKNIRLYWNFQSRIYIYIYTATVPKGLISFQEQLYIYKTNKEWEFSWTFS
jgi:hypothetical protein